MTATVAARWSAAATRASPAIAWCAPAILERRSRHGCWRWSATFHKAQPLADGIPREEARERVFARARPAVFELVLGDLARAQTLVVRDRLALPGHRLELSPEEPRAREAVEARIRRRV